MLKQEKKLIIDELVDKLSAHSHFYITDSSGLTVKKINEFRRKCSDSGIEYKVYKNTLIRKALEKDPQYDDQIFSVLKGFSGIIFSKDSANLPGKVIRNFHKTEKEKPVLKGAYVNGSLYIGKEHLQELSELKSKDELIGEIIALLQSPAKNVLSALLNSKDTLAGLVKTLEKRKQ